MSPIAFSQNFQIRAVEVHSAIVFMVRILTWKNPHGEEPDDSRGLINVFDPANVPVTACHGVQIFGGIQIVAVQMIPSAAFAGPKKLLVRHPAKFEFSV